MTNLEAIEERKSRRTYLATPIEPEKLTVLQSLIDSYNHEANLSIRLRQWLLYGGALFLVTLVPLLAGPDALSPTTASTSMTMAFVAAQTLTRASWKAETASAALTSPVPAI